MYTSYSSLACRSRSTTDIFKAHSLDDTSQPPMTYAATLTRVTSSVTMSNSRRRPPVPPQRSDSFAGVVPSTLKRVRADDTRRPLVETSTPTHQQAQTPRSTFVQKLVASLERRQKEISGAYCKAADDEFFVRRNVERDEATALLENEREEEVIVMRPDAGPQQRYTYARLPVTQLEDLPEREHEEDDEEVDDFSDDEPTTASEFWSTRNLVSPPISPPIFLVNSNINDTVDPDPPKATFQRTIKNMLSSILSWRPTSKNLPKGSREYYSARESLGDEMGTFRKKTMSRLIERANSKGGLDRSRGESSRRDLQEFSSFIGKPKSLDDTIASKPSIATIHPMHGTLKRSASRAQDIKPPVNKEVVYGSIKVQLPAVPIRRSSLPTEPRLWQLPSKTRDLHKRTTCAAAPMQEPAGPGSRASSVIYDVPRSSRWLPPREPEPSPPYENFRAIVSHDRSIFRNN